MSELLGFAGPALILASELNPWLFATGAVIIGLCRLIGARSQGIISRGARTHRDRDAARQQRLVFFFFVPRFIVAVA